jgi:NAD(P)-dependent dehydrogenase (short-subunit alcohol dehydrogenase family)
MRETGGRIVNVTSRGAFRGEPRHPAYGASKAGLNSFGQSMARALAPYGISVATVAPGYVETEMAAGDLHSARGDEIRAQSPFNRVATPEEIAAAVLYLGLRGRYDRIAGGAPGSPGAHSNRADEHGAVRRGERLYAAGFSSW